MAAARKENAVGADEVGALTNALTRHTLSIRLTKKSSGSQAKIKPEAKISLQVSEKNNEQATPPYQLGESNEEDKP